MEILESIAWIASGFVPMLGALELAWRIDKKGRFKKTMATIQRGHFRRPITKIALTHYNSSLNRKMR
jgi:hypothetical protein